MHGKDLQGIGSSTTHYVAKEESWVLHVGIMKKHLGVLNGMIHLMETMITELGSLIILEMLLTKLGREIEP